ncbi:MAG: M20/M25/M40 family metallo-hydrolase, partial [bacterium]
MQKHGISTPDFWVFSNAEEDMSDVKYPVIVKPKMEAVSYGLKIVNNENDLREAVKFIVGEFQQQALVEQFIRGREFCIGLLGNDNLEAFPVLEIDLEGDPDGIQTAGDKLKRPRNKICPANISPEIADDMVKLSKKAFRVTGLRDFSRVDIRIDENQNVYLLEINSMASLGLTGAYVNAAQVAGYDYVRLVNKMLDVAAVRYFSESYLPQETEDLKKPAKKLPLSIRIRGFMRSRQERSEKLLKQMVNMNTYVRNVEGVNALGNLMMQNLSPLGFTQQVIPQVEVGNILLFSNTPDNRYDALLLGHLDNLIPFKKQQNYRETEQCLYGSGIWGNKGGLMVTILALQALRFARLLRKLKVAILLTSDNSLRGQFAQDHVSHVANRAKVVIGLKGGGIDSTIVTSRSGAAFYTCQMNLEKTDKAEDVSKFVANFLRLLTGWAELTDETKGVVVAPRAVDIKSSIAELFAQGEASISVRSNELSLTEETEKKILQMAKKMSRGKQRVQVEGGIRRPPMLRSDGVEKLWNRLKEVANRLDIRLIEEHRWSSADICFVNDNKPMIDGMGPIGLDQTGKDEYILRHSLSERATLLAMLLYNLSKEPIK